jgi:AcrR family transcriptional regulator
VLATTLEVYGEVGWAGLTMDIVARRARVGKAALYRRWPTKEKLIVAALASRVPAESVLDTGSLRGDLLTIANEILARYTTAGADGLVRVRAMVEAKTYPELFGPAVDHLTRAETQIGRDIILRAIDRGELRRGTSPALVLDAVAGTIMHHALMTPHDKMAALAEVSAQYAEVVVDFVLSAVGYQPQVAT